MRSSAPTSAREALAAGYVVAMPVERSGADEFEYGDEFREHIAAFDPTFSKVLVATTRTPTIRVRSRGAQTASQAQTASGPGNP